MLCQQGQLEVQPGPNLAMGCLIPCVGLESIDRVGLYLHWVWRSHKFCFVSFYRIHLVHFNLHDLSIWGIRGAKSLWVAEVWRKQDFRAYFWLIQVQTLREEEGKEDAEGGERSCLM